MVRKHKKSLEYDKLYGKLESIQNYDYAQKVNLVC